MRVNANFVWVRHDNCLFQGHLKIFKSLNDSDSEDSGSLL